MRTSIRIIPVSELVFFSKTGRKKKSIPIIHLMILTKIFSLFLFIIVSQIQAGVPLLPQKNIVSVGEVQFSLMVVDRNR